MPQWASVTLLIAGAAAMAAGGTVAAVGDSTNDYPVQLAGASVLGVGAAGLLVGVIVLTVDEVRTINALEHQATLNWKMRF